jgi:hypothetical protein
MIYFFLIFFLDAIAEIVTSNKIKTKNIEKKTKSSPFIIYITIF